MQGSNTERAPNTGTSWTPPTGVYTGDAGLAGERRRLTAPASVTHAIVSGVGSSRGVSTLLGLLEPAVTVLAGEYARARAPPSAGCPHHTSPCHRAARWARRGVRPLPVALLTSVSQRVEPAHLYKLSCGTGTMPSAGALRSWRSRHGQVHAHRRGRLRVRAPSSASRLRHPSSASSCCTMGSALACGTCGCRSCAAGARALSSSAGTLQSQRRRREWVHAHERGNLCRRVVRAARLRVIVRHDGLGARVWGVRPSPAVALTGVSPYQLRYGRTGAVVEAVAGIHDGRFIAFVTWRRTVHFFVVDPYGGCAAFARSCVERRESEGEAAATSPHPRTCTSCAAGALVLSSRPSQTRATGALATCRHSVHVFAVNRCGWTHVDAHMREETVPP
ncbi:hypothetical protein B0H10DRAFT_1984600 [Mycena sp. CBHHK59/15]|nr:hypothetical protein B0H10DRAFT_1984600 [Mycena sp. CBHHK59/15]